ncbi:MAG: zinc-ribbon domain-containing protein [Nitrospirae bacterium]|nr:zinc-ribbon domain-containing protein [Nitrospirota bacterium]
MVVICPKCRVKLKVDEARLSPEGSRFKCPKCAAVLVVRRPAAQPQRKLNAGKVLVGHSNPALLQTISSVLSAAGYSVITALDGIDLIVKALKEGPFLVIVEVGLPKIYGFEVCKRLKSRAETKEMKFILIPAIHDKSKYRREPTSLYGADDYIEEFDIASQLIISINRLLGVPQQEEAKTGEPEKPPAEGPKLPPPVVRQPPPRQETEMKKMPEAAPPAEIRGKDADEKIEKARRLSRTIINDIYLYNSDKVNQAIKAGDFYAVFSQEIKEGKKLYDNRIPREIREVHDYYREAIENFITAKKAV